jgi:tetratricopeptide (TPR) repeat protein
LAIELAAARVKLLSPQALLTRLSQRLKVLTGGSQDMPARQQTLRNTIDWSYSLLDQTEQILFSRLAVFVGGFTLETAEAICNADNIVPLASGQNLDILEGVASLLNKSLLVQQGDSSQLRFRMLETIREYALERLEVSGQLEALQQQHAYYFAAQLDQIWLDFHFYGGHRLDWAEEEHDNLRAMLAWSLAKPDEIELGLRMVGILYWFWYRRGYLSEGRAWCHRFMTSASKNLRTRDYASFLMGNGSLALMQTDLVEAGHCLQLGTAIFRELGDEERLAMSLLGWGVLALYQGDTAKAQCIFEESLAIGKRLNLWWVIADSLLNMGNAVAAQGDYSTARTWLEQAAAVAKSNDEAWLVANVLNNLGEVARIQGDYEQAQCNYEESQLLFRTMDAKSDVARSLHNLGYVALHQGDNEGARTNFQEGLSVFQELGNKRGVAECLAGLVAMQG